LAVLPLRWTMGQFFSALIGQVSVDMLYLIFQRKKAVPPHILKEARIKFNYANESSLEAVAP